MMNRVPCHDGPKWNQRISLTRLFGISSDEDRLKTFDMLNSDCMIKKEGGSQTTIRSCQTPFFKSANSTAHEIFLNHNIKSTKAYGERGGGG